MFRTEEKTNKALARAQRQGGLAAVCRPARGEAHEGLQERGQRELALGSPGHERLT